MTGQSLIPAASPPGLLGLSRSGHCTTSPYRDWSSNRPKRIQPLHSVSQSLSDRTNSLITELVHYFQKVSYYRIQSITDINSPVLTEAVPYWQNHYIHWHVIQLAWKSIMTNIIRHSDARNDKWGCRNVLSGACHAPYGAVTVKTVFGEKLLQYLFTRHKSYRDCHEI